MAIPMSTILLFPTFSIILLHPIESASPTTVDHRSIASPGLPFTPFGLVLETYPDYLRTSTNITSSCWKHLTLLSQELGRQLWTVQMLDSTGKMPSGLLRTNNKWLGNFQECLDIRANTNASQEDAYLFGQYCFTSFTVTTNSSLVEIQKIQKFQVGICVPSSCLASDVQNLLNQAFKVAGVEASFKVNEKYCQIQEVINLDGLAIAVIFILVVFVIVVVVGTVLDVLRLTQKETFSQKRSETMTVYHNSTKNLFTPQPGSLAADILQCFSLRASASSLFDVTRHPASIDALHGIRFLSMAWIIVFHTYTWLIKSGCQNMTDLGSLRQNFLAEILLNGNVAVDTFFCISGLLVAYVYLRKLHTTNGGMGLVYYYFHRYWRLTPVYAIFVGLMAGLCGLFGSGPSWPDFINHTRNCRKNWWLNLLYVSNIFNLSEMCQTHCWFLSCDMQLFLFSPIIIYTMFRRPRIGVSVALIAILLSCVVNGLITYYRQLGPSTILLAEMYSATRIRYLHEMYIKPYSRIGPYCIGMLTGFLLTTTKNSIDMRKMQVIVGWSLAVICNLTILFGLYGFVADNSAPSLVESALYSGLSRTAWAIGIAWLVTACATGYGGLVNSILSGSVFLPLSRLTYCSYIIHRNILQMYFSSRKTVLFYDVWNAMYVFLGTMVFSYVLAIPFYLIFEFPMLKLEKVLLDIWRQSRAKEEPTATSDSKIVVNASEAQTLDKPICLQSKSSTNYRTISTTAAFELKKSEENSGEKSGR